MRDEEIVQLITEKDFRSCNKCMRYLYKSHYPMIRKMVTENSGNEEDAKDVFQETLVGFYKNVKKGQFELKSKLSTYLYTVAKFQWMKKLKKKSDHHSIDGDDIMQLKSEADLNNTFEFSERQLYIGELLSKSGDRCKKILQYVYYDKLRMKEIALRMKFASDQEARNQKLKCIKKVRAIVDNNDFYKSTFRNLN